MGLGRKVSAAKVGPSQRPVLATASAPAGGYRQENRRRNSDRRSHSLGSFIYGGFRPRRRDGRRAGDDQRVFLDWHEPRVLWLVLATLLMSCTDAVLTLNILATGGSEMNGLMDWLIRNDVMAFIWVKISVTSIGLILLALLANRRIFGQFPVIRLLEALCFGYGLLMLWEVYLLTTV